MSASALVAERHQAKHAENRDVTNYSNEATVRQKNIGALIYDIRRYAVDRHEKFSEHFRCRDLVVYEVAVEFRKNSGASAAARSAAKRCCGSAVWVALTPVARQRDFGGLFAALGKVIANRRA